MSELKQFQCDVTGQKYGSKNAGDGLLEFEIRRHRGGSPYEISKRLIHISMDELTDNVGNAWPQRIKYLGVKMGDVVGMCYGYKPNIRSSDLAYPYEERDSVVIDHYEPFFQYVEEEVIY